MADEVAGLVENEHRRRGDAALRFGRVLLGGTLARGERARPVNDPDAIGFVGRDA
jgi:hypothetical protein